MEHERRISVAAYIIYFIYPCFLAVYRDMDDVVDVDLEDEIASTRPASTPSSTPASAPASNPATPPQEDASTSGIRSPPAALPDDSFANKLRLCCQCLGNFCRTMSQAVHRPALQKIEIALAGFIPQIAACTPGHHRCWSGCTWHQGRARRSSCGLHR